MNNPFSLIVFAILMFAVGWLIVRLLTARGAAEYRREAEKLQRTSQLSARDAAARAALLLADGELFHCIESSLNDTATLEGLAPEIASLFARYETIELLKAPWAIVSRSEIGYSAQKQGFLRIGSISVGTDVEGEIAVRRGEEAIYELHPNEAPDPTFGTHRSIYHWIVAVAEEVV